MKITGGKYRGKSIESRPERTVRPTTSFVREAIFNILKHGKFLYDDQFIADDNPDQVADRRVVDIFCGTGALGIEALSRGATHVTFVDQNSQTLSLTRQNVAHIGELDRAAFLRSDSTMLPRAPKPCHLAFIDPPYHQELVSKALKSLKQQGWLEPGAIVVIEQGKRDDSTVPEGFILLSDRVHDKTRITLLQYQG